jgi:hypothetical protein
MIPQVSKQSSPHAPVVKGRPWSCPRVAGAKPEPRVDETPKETRKGNLPGASATWQGTSITTASGATLRGSGKVHGWGASSRGSRKGYA